MAPCRCARSTCVTLLLPGLSSAAQASLEVSGRELRVRSLLPGVAHALDVPLPRAVDPDSASARWSRRARQLTVRLRAADPQQRDGRASAARADDHVVATSGWSRSGAHGGRGPMPTCCSFVLRLFKGGSRKTAAAARPDGIGETERRVVECLLQIQSTRHMWARLLVDHEGRSPSLCSATARDAPPEAEAGGPSGGRTPLDLINDWRVEEMSRRLADEFSGKQALQEALAAREVQLQEALAQRDQLLEELRLEREQTRRDHALQLSEATSRDQEACRLQESLAAEISRQAIRSALPTVLTTPQPAGPAVGASLMDARALPLVLHKR
ncbi:unnamed protein product [Prorocentrum cordatum]|uniref:PIH1D1/2/3 CS-like domain-containing protein n=1 Tax=Prorocentrum cordatum TaxID=2364126 RepID=A0ABN9X0W0_9DINO|nr:unnamed protein product [Polarella glacialis]